MISGTTGLSGATDSNFVLRKNRRRDNTATLYSTGRDIAYRELSLEFDGESHIWRLLANSCEQDEQSDGRLTILLLNLLREQGEFIGTPTELSEKIDPDKQEGVTPKKVARLILQSVETLRRTGITAIIRRSNGEADFELTVPKVTILRMPEKSTLSPLPPSTKQPLKLREGPSMRNPPLKRTPVEAQRLRVRRKKAKHGASEFSTTVGSEGCKVASDVGKQSAVPTLSVLAPPEHRRIPGRSPDPLYGGANEAEERKTDHAPGYARAI